MPLQDMLIVITVLQPAEDADATMEGSTFEESSMEPDAPQLILTLDSDDEPDPFLDALRGSGLDPPEPYAAAHAPDSCLKTKSWCQLGSPVSHSNKAFKMLLQPGQVCFLDMDAHVSLALNVQQSSKRSVTDMLRMANTCTLTHAACPCTCLLAEHIIGCASSVCIHSCEYVIPCVIQSQACICCAVSTGIMILRYNQQHHCALCHLIIGVMRSVLLQRIVTGSAVKMPADVPRGAAADPLAKCEANPVQGQSKAAVGSAIVPVGMLPVVSPVVSPAPLHHSSGLGDAMQQEGGDGVEETLPDRNMRVRY